MLAIQRKMPLQDQYALASKARTKLMRCAKDAQRANREYNLRVLVGHANLLDKITENVERINLLKRQSPQPQEEEEEDLHLSRQFSSEQVELPSQQHQESAHNADYYYYSSDSESEEESEDDSEYDSEEDDEAVDEENAAFTYDICEQDQAADDEKVHQDETLHQDYIVKVTYNNYAGRSSEQQQEQFTTIWEEPCEEEKGPSRGNLQLCNSDKDDFKESTEVCSGSDSDEHTLNSPLDDNDAFKTFQKLNNLQLHQRSAETLV